MAITLEKMSKMVQAVQWLHDETGQFFNKSGLLPSEKSIASYEKGRYPRPESVETTYSLGWILIEAAADQLFAFTRSVAEPAQTIAPYTCVRAVLETSALSAWLLDPVINVKERVQRGFAFRYEGLEQQVKFLKASGLGDEVTKANRRIEEIEKFALSLGYPQITNRLGKRIGIAQKMPSVTEIIRDILKEESTYRLLSAMTHAHHWAIQQLSYKIVGRFNDNPVLEKNLQPEMIAFLCYKAMLAFARPGWYLSRLYGWNVEKLVAILDTAADELSIQQDFCYWKKATRLE